MFPTRADRLAFVVDYVSRTLQRHGIWHALAFGTLLGAVRDQDIIAWDSDVDFFIRPSDVPRLLALNPMIAADGFAFTHTWIVSSVLAMNPRGATVSSGGRLTIAFEGSGVGDLYPFSLFSDGVLRWYDFEQDAYWCPESSFPHYFVEQPGEAVIRGRRYPAPRDAEHWLSYIYSPRWREPYRPGLPRTDDVNVWGYTYAPTLRTQIAWCEARGWNRAQYAHEPHWPRLVAAAGPDGWAPRGEDADHIRWWRSLDQIVEWY